MDKRRASTLTSVDVGAHWHEHHADEIGTRNETTIGYMAVCFFHLCQGAGLGRLVKGRRGVTADAALDLSKALGTSPEIWMNLQTTWDLRRAEMRRRAS